MTYKTKKIVAVLLPIQIVMIKILGSFPNFIEQYYSNGFYLFVSKLERFLWGWIPFSIGDVFYGLLLFFALRWLYQNKNNWRLIPMQLSVHVVAFLSIISFVFHLFWGMNYYRVPLHKTLKLHNKYTTEQLIEVTQKLITETNAIQYQITKNDSIKVSIPYSVTELLLKTENGYNTLSKHYPTLTYKQLSLKKSLFSFPLTYMGFSGYLNPFTNEAQINYLPPKYHLPLTACHEMGHQMGYAAENETNFIGYLAAKHNDDMYFKYAATTFAVRYCLNELYLRDKKTCDKLYEQLHVGVRKNFEDSRHFWKAHQNPIEVALKWGFDLFLKSKNQSKGIDSYSYVVALIVNEEIMH